MIVDKTNEFFVEGKFVFWFGSYFVVKVGTVERTYVYVGVLYLKIFQNVLLNFRSCGCSECNHGNVARNVFYYRVYSSVFGSEIVSPFRNTVSFVDGIKTDFDALQQFYVFLFVQRLRCDVSQLCFARKQVFSHLSNFVSVES